MSNGDWKETTGGKGGAEGEGKPPGPVMVETRDPLTAFLFLLIRDRMPMGNIVDVVNQAKKLFDNRRGIGRLQEPLASIAASMAAALRGEGP